MLLALPRKARHVICQCLYVEELWTCSLFLCKFPGFDDGEAWGDPS